MQLRPQLNLRASVLMDLLSYGEEDSILLADLNFALQELIMTAYWRSTLLFKTHASARAKLMVGSGSFTLAVRSRNFSFPDDDNGDIFSSDAVSIQVRLKVPLSRRQFTQQISYPVQ